MSYMHCVCATPLRYVEKVDGLYKYICNDCNKTWFYDKVNYRMEFDHIEEVRLNFLDDDLFVM